MLVTSSLNHLITSLPKKHYIYQQKHNNESRSQRLDMVWYVSFIYILFVIGYAITGNLLGLGIIFDLYISKKVNWTFWKNATVKTAN